MRNSNIKVAYQKYLHVSNLSNDRIFLGLREVATFKVLLNIIGYKFNNNLSFLDLGCADRFLEPACIREKWTYKGLDYNDINFEKDVFPIDNNSVDFAVSLAVIEHLNDPDLFVSEIFRCLKPGGVIFLSTPNFQYDFKNFYNDPTHVRPYTPISLERLLNLYGFLFPFTFPGVRLKSKFWYLGKYRFFKAFYFLPFRADTSWKVPNFLKGHSRSIFAIAQKPF